ncbi:hypothetical protein BU16DRAFT_244232 [Lophium mytilinum]|uniref:Uncharacterized protein n=1 Tax=Lophium mytilinum TaxID=390894 RepID=A0A6A6R721_9PEZI|nr:hypothetical protein BU16DRAFT_244232 [Lophium mytilinum]
MRPFSHLKRRCPSEWTARRLAHAESSQKQNLKTGLTNLPAALAKSMKPFLRHHVINLPQDHNLLFYPSKLHPTEASFELCLTDCPRPRFNSKHQPRFRALASLTGGDVVSEHAIRLLIGPAARRQRLFSRSPTVAGPCKPASFTNHKETRNLRKASSTTRARVHMPPGSISASQMHQAHIPPRPCLYDPGLRTL